MTAVRRPARRRGRAQAEPARRRARPAPRPAAGRAPRRGPGRGRRPLLLRDRRRGRAATRSPSSRSSRSSRRSAPTASRAFEDVCAYARTRRAARDRRRQARRHRLDGARYAAAYLEGEPPLADALTVNPYLGRDSLEPFLSACRRHGAGIFCLVKTSNAGSADVQDLTLSDGRPSGMHVAELVADWGEDLVGEHGLSSVGAVVGATLPRAVGEARRLMPQPILLLPGIGAQGGTPGRRRARVHERPGERARLGVALGDLRVPRGLGRLARRCGRRGRAAARGDLGRLRLVAAATRRGCAAPAAFLAGVTVAVLLVAERPARRDHEHARRRPSPPRRSRRRRPGARRRRPPPKAVYVDRAVRRHVRPRSRSTTTRRSSGSSAEPRPRPDGAPVGQQVRVR